MTNYNERLDEILAKHNGELGVTREDPDVVTPDTKKLITSLIKELVAEAKPTNSQTQRGSVTVYGDLSERDLNIINQFEQNLLKALEEK